MKWCLFGAPCTLRIHGRPAENPSVQLLQGWGSLSQRAALFWSCCARVVCLTFLTSQNCSLYLIKNNFYLWTCCNTGSRVTWVQYRLFIKATRRWFGAQSCRRSRGSTSPRAPTWSCKAEKQGSCTGPSTPCGQKVSKSLLMVLGFPKH